MRPLRHGDPRGASLRKSCVPARAMSRALAPLGWGVSRPWGAGEMTENRASVVQVARLPFQGGDGGAIPTQALHVTIATVREVNPLLASAHYLGPVHAARICFAAWRDDQLVACQVYRWPTGRMIPQDWLELSRWCITPDAGENAGSRMMGVVRRFLPLHVRYVSTLVSYSDPSHGHTGALYRASGWENAPTHHEERFNRDGIGYPSGHGSWDGITRQTPKNRWIYKLAAGRRDE